MLVDAGYAIIDNSTENEFDPSDCAPTYGIVYKEIDRYALNTSQSDNRLVEALATNLTKHARNDAEKARAIYRWITDRIDIDIERLHNQKQGQIAEDPGDILESRKTVCCGYARLFQALGNACGLDVVVINGSSKNCTPGFKSTEAEDHVWNAVRIEGRWRLLDCTWGAGKISGGKFIPKFEDHYFFTSPEDFVYDHFPKNKIRLNYI
jgi:transglutaminase/protease-like cytokinesis protein 3